MIEQNPFSNASLVGDSDLADLFALFSAKFEKLHSAVIYEFGPNGVYILGAFVGFLALILLIYIKSVIDTFRIADGESSDAGLFYTAAQAAAAGDIERLNSSDAEDFMEMEKPRLTIDADDETFARQRYAAKIEKDKELSRELVASSAITDDILQLKEQLKNQAQKRYDMQLDWQKNSETVYEDLAHDTELKYNQQQETIDHLISLIINMLSRQVSTEKIAQAVYYRNQGQTEKEEILQTISAVKDFISLCNTGKFDRLPNRSELPDNEEAIYAWAKGDNSYCLSLMENLIKQQIDKADTQNGLVKELTYAQAASYACIFGNIAGTNNSELAQNSFELALELAPQNTNAWSRCGDIYWQQGNFDKAVYAYQTVVENGDNVLYAPQIANAQHKLALYYADNGKNNTAMDLEQNSINYYQNSGITTSLSEQENQTLQYIEQTGSENLQPAILKLLQNQQAQYM